jgi:hypothetical protein
MIWTHPLKYSVANTVEQIKGKSAVRIHRDCIEREEVVKDFIFGQQDILKHLI